MSRVAYVNGRYLRHSDARVHVEDRGYQFADGVYEVIAVRRGALVDAEAHLRRLDRSLRELRIPWPMSRAALTVVLTQMLRRNRLSGDGIVYLQVTRGVARRDHAFPTGAKPTLVMTARSLPPFDPALGRRGVAVVTAPDVRWARCDIKSVSLLPNVLAKQQALDASAFDTWMVAGDGTVTEGTASNAWIVTSGGELVTRDAGRAILNGITRQAILTAATEAGVRFSERPFTVDEAKTAREAFLTSTTAMVKAVVRIDETAIGDGRIGPITDRLLDLYFGHFDQAGRSIAP